MRATTTLGNLIEQVETMSAGNFDETVSLSEIEFGSLNEMWIGGVGVERRLVRAARGGHAVRIPARGPEGPGAPAPGRRQRGVRRHRWKRKRTLATTYLPERLPSQYFRRWRA